jgi:hypothetical protein
MAELLRRRLLSFVDEVREGVEQSGGDVQPNGDAPIDIGDEAAAASKKKVSLYSRNKRILYPCTTD